MTEETKVDHSKNWLVNYWKNLRNTGKNINKIRSSPYAALNLSLKIRKIVITVLILYLGWMTYSMIRTFKAVGFMNTVGKLVIFAVMVYICWKIYETIPQAKRQLEYYKKYPHTINYTPTDTKETVDSIMQKIKDNNAEGAAKTMWSKKKTTNISQPVPKLVPVNVEEVTEPVKTVKPKQEQETEQFEETEEETEEPETQENQIELTEENLMKILDKMAQDIENIKYHLRLDF